MSTTVNESPAIDLNDPSVVELILDNKDIAALPLGSAEQIAALEALSSGKKEENSADSSEDEQDSEEQSSEGEQDEEGDPSDPETSEEQSDEEGEEDQNQEANKPKNGVQKKIDKLTKKIHDLERQLQSKTEQPEADVEPQDLTPKFDKPKPRFADFEEIEQFYEADAEWRHEKAEFERAQKAQKEENNKQAATLAQTWDQRAAAVKATVDDFDEVVTTEAVKKSGAMQPALSYVFKQELGPQIAYNLFTDPQKLSEFKAADAADQVAILVELKMAIAPPKKTTVTKAPAPPKPLPKSSGSATRTVIKDDISDAEFDRILAQEIKKSKKLF